MKLTFLGTKGDIEESEWNHEKNAALLIEYKGKKILVDFGKEFTRGDWQRIRPDYLVLTHAHEDHAGGLAKLKPEHLEGVKVVCSDVCWNGPSDVKDGYKVKDFKALFGDPSDNIPGATGIGKKTAVELLGKYKTIKELYSSIEKGEAWDLNQKIKEILIKYKNQVFLSYELAETRIDAPIDFNLKNCKWLAPSLHPNIKKKVKQIFEDHNFYSLIKKIP